MELCLEWWWMGEVTNFLVSPFAQRHKGVLRTMGMPKSRVFRILNHFLFILNHYLCDCLQAYTC